MNRTLMIVLAVATGVTLTSTAMAQGRHDDRPHGQGKPAQAASASDDTAATGTRHDDRSHGPKKTAKKKDKSATSGGESGGGTASSGTSGSPAK